MRPSILGFFTVGMTTLSMLSVSCVLYSAGSGIYLSFITSQQNIHVTLYDSFS